MNSENLVGFVYILCSIPCFIVFIRVSIFYTFTIKKWNTTEGIILQSEPVYRASNDSDTSGWKTKLTFEYCVLGTRFHSDKYSKNIGMLSSYKTSVDMSDIPKTGKEVTVYYNPKNPQISVIDNKIGYGSFAPLIFGVLAAIIGYNMLP